jgi:tryptophan synthase alpha chain
MSLKGTLKLIERFRSGNRETPIVLMGYFNPIHAYGAEKFAHDAGAAGVDGLIVVDLGPEEDSVLRPSAKKAGLDIVRLATPTTDEKRLTTVLDGASGFLYYVSVAGVTGTKTFAETDVRDAVARIKRVSKLPCAVGFGIRSPEQAAQIARFADAAVVGSAIVSGIAKGLADGKAKVDVIADTLSFCSGLANAIRTSRA